MEIDSKPYLLLRYNAVAHSTARAKNCSAVGRNNCFAGSKKSVIRLIYSYNTMLSHTQLLGEKTTILVGETTDLQVGKTIDLQIEDTIALRGRGNRLQNPAALMVRRCCTLHRSVDQENNRSTGRGKNRFLDQENNFFAGRETIALRSQENRL